MLMLALRGLRFHKGGFVATFIALLFGTVLVMACGGLMETGIRNAVPPQRLAGAALLVTGDRSYELPRAPSSDTGKHKHKRKAVFPELVPLDAGLVPTLRSVPGVRSAVGEQTFRTALLGRGGASAQGHGWDSAALTPYALTSGTAPRGPDDVVLDTGLARRSGARAGEWVRIAAHGGSARFEVTGVVRPAAGREVPQPTMFFSAPEAVRLSGRPHTVADIAITVSAGTGTGALRERVTAALAGRRVSILSGDGRGVVEHPEVLAGRSQLISLSGVFGGMATLVAVLVVAGTVGLSVQQRHREFALMRAVGGTARQVRRMLVGETLTVAVLAAALARPIGPHVGRWLFGRLVGAGMVASTVEFHEGWIPALAAGGALLLTAVLGGVLGARRAVRARPVEALAQAAVEQTWFGWPRLLLAVLFLGGTAALAIVTTGLDGPTAASTAGPTVLTCAIGLALLAPALTRLLAALLAGPLGLVTGRSGRLAVLNLRARTVRTAAVVTPIMLATAVATANLYLQTTTTTEARRAFTDNLRADAVVTSASGGVGPSLLEAVRAVPGVADASEFTTTSGFIERPVDSAQDKHGLPIQGVSGDGAAGTLAVRPTAGSLSLLRGDTVALPGDLARSLGRGVGDTMRLRLGDGTAVNVRVVALFTGRAGYESLLAPASLVAPHTTDGLPRQILVRAADGTSRERLMTSLRGLAAAHPGLTVATRDTLIDADTQDTGTQAWVNYLIVGMIAAYTALALVNTLVTATSNRRREFGLQRLSGATRAQVLWMAAVEAVLVSVIGVVLGTAAAATTLVPFSEADSGGWLPSGPLWIYLAVAGTVAALTGAATLIPTWAVLRVRPVTAAKG